MANPHRTLGEDSIWVEFKDSGYPFKLRKDLQKASNDEETLTLVIPYVVRCHIPTVDGVWLEKINSFDDLLEVDERIAINIFLAFFEFRGERQREPLPKVS